MRCLLVRPTENCLRLVRGRTEAPLRVPNACSPSPTTPTLPIESLVRTELRPPGTLFDVRASSTNFTGRNAFPKASALRKTPFPRFSGNVRTVATRLARGASAKGQLGARCASEPYPYVRRAGIVRPLSGRMSSPVEAVWPDSAVWGSAPPISFVPDPGLSSTRSYIAITGIADLPNRAHQGTPICMWDRH